MNYNEFFYEIFTYIRKVYNKGIQTSPIPVPTLTPPGRIFEKTLHFRGFRAIKILKKQKFPNQRYRVEDGAIVNLGNIVTPLHSKLRGVKTLFPEFSILLQCGFNNDSQGTFKGPEFLPKCF